LSGTPPDLGNAALQGIPGGNTWEEQFVRE
jgi:hypothetical protein